MCLYLRDAYFLYIYIEIPIVSSLWGIIVLIGSDFIL